MSGGKTINGFQGRLSQEPELKAASSSWFTRKAII
jgi:hypothetical protein